MTGLLQDVLKRVERLPDAEQDLIAAQISEALDDDSAWERSFASERSALRSLAGEALSEHRAGETRPLDDLIG